MMSPSYSSAHSPSPIGQGFAKVIAHSSRFDRTGENHHLQDKPLHL